MKNKLARIHSLNNVTATITKQRVHVLNLV